MAWPKTRQTYEMKSNNFSTGFTAQIILFIQYLYFALMESVQCERERKRERNAGKLISMQMPEQSPVFRS